MYSASDLRKGLRVEVNGAPYIITEFNFVKPGKGQAIYNCKLKNMLTGATLTKSYRSTEKIEEAKVEERVMNYSYQQGNDYVFMDKNYEQVNIGADILGDSRFFLEEDLEVTVIIYNGNPVGVELPTFVEKEIVHTEPGVRGNTATNVLKPAQIEGGYEIRVPLFVNRGDIVKIDTRTGEYRDRVRQSKVSGG